MKIPFIRSVAALGVSTALAVGYGVALAQQPGTQTTPGTTMHQANPGSGATGDQNMPGSMRPSRPRPGNTVPEVKEPLGEGQAVPNPPMGTHTPRTTVPEQSQPPGMNAPGNHTVPNPPPATQAPGMTVPEQSQPPGMNAPGNHAVTNPPPATQAPGSTMPEESRRQGMSQSGMDQGNSTVPSNSAPSTQAPGAAAPQASHSGMSN